VPQRSTHSSIYALFSRIADARQADARRQQEEQAAANEEAKMTAEIAETVRVRVEAAMASPEVAVKIQQRLQVPTASILSS